MASSLPKKIFVGPTPTTLTEEALLEYFSRFGSIDGLELVI
jgi:RNA recognition motif-containing protein